MYNDEQINQIVNDFIQDLCENKDKWTGCKTGDKGLFEWSEQSNIAQSIRAFVKKEFVDLSIEDFVVKIYSGDSSARVFETDVNGVEIPTPETTTAANNIHGKLSAQSQALALVEASFNLPQCCNNVYITIPANCKYLYDAISNIS